MTRAKDYRTLLVDSLVALAVGLVAVAICYQWVDRPVAFFVYDRQVEKVLIFKWLTYPPPIVQSWSPLVLRWRWFAVPGGGWHIGNGRYSWRA